MTIGCKRRGLEAPRCKHLAGMNQIVVQLYDTSAVAPSGAHSFLENSLSRGIFVLKVLIKINLYIIFFTRIGLYYFGWDKTWHLIS